MTAESNGADDWMSANDAMLWEIERDPVLRSPITAVLWFDAPPADERVDAMVDRLVSRMPRLTQRVAPSPARVSTPRWEHDPHFDVTFHLRRLNLPSGRAGRRDVLDHAQRMAARAFDRDRPPWEIEFLGATDDGAGACVMRFHHAIADGLGLVSMMQHMVDLERDPSETDTGTDPVDGAGGGTPTAGASSTVERLAAAAAHRAETETNDLRRAVTGGFKTAFDLARQPLVTAKRVASTGSSIIKVIAPATTPLSPVMTKRSTLIHMETVDADLAAMKSAANAHDASVNDAFVTIVAAALDRYHRRHDQPTEAIRMHMPVSIRNLDAPGKLDNQFTPTRFIVPLGDTPLVERLHQIQQLLLEVRAQPALPYTADITTTVRRLGESASTGIVGAMMRGVDVTTSNVPGPPFPVFLAGSQITDFYGFGPLAGSAINITFFSYDGTAHLAISTDVAAMSDPDAFVEDLETSIAEFAELAHAT